MDSQIFTMNISIEIIDMIMANKVAFMSSISAKVVRNSEFTLVGDISPCFIPVKFNLLRRLYSGMCKYAKAGAACTCLPGTVVV